MTEPQSIEAPSIDAAAKLHAPSISVRSYLSTHHLGAALLSVRQAEEFEQRYRPVVPRFSIEHRSHVMQAVLCSVAFLEAAINEVLKDTDDGHDSYVGDLSDEGRRLLAVVWRLAEGGVRGRASILKKYECALQVLGKEAFDRGQAPYQDAALVVELRNTLMHYKPDSYGGDQQHQLAAKLKGKFDSNPMMASGNPFFPDQCLGSPCARWSVNAVRTFADAFFLRLGITPNFQRALDNLLAGDAKLAADLKAHRGLGSG